MSKNIELMVFDPAGNTTLMVLTPVPRSEYAETARRLLEIDFDDYCDWRGTAYGEQVAFVLEDSMEMCGLEFCGNASRSYAYYRVLRGGGEDVGGGIRKIDVKVSGCAHPLTAFVDLEAKDSVIQMPLPKTISMIDTAKAGVPGSHPFVEFDGISHLVLKGEEADAGKFERIKNYFYAEISPGMDAFGAMFINEDEDLMRPVVYVRDVDTTYFEGSCASGTAAAAAAVASEEPDGSYDYVFRQPDGTLNASVAKAGGRVTEIRLGGIIETTDIIHVEI
ncbi:MAG: hypothetical protein ACSW8G_02215 [Bacillota bacterium]